ncbi:DUF2381 family protein [Hyalangium versicolor]|uniref:DUF2381 family protein n=1 Tax=Hyalangium versicolor TaxID=2861190 RepID=UPI001CCA7749|nr:DUF2381 family protein [Hyalangium versicolor]
MLAALPLLSAVLAATLGVVAPPSPPDCEAAPQPLVLSAESSAPLVLCVSPDTATTLLFDTSLAPGAVEVQASEQEVRLAQGPGVVTLVPSARLLPGEWRKLTVRFGDGAAPALATVLLYVHPARATRQVEVQRKPRTVESYQREVAEQKEQVRQCQRENAQLRASQGKPEGLRGLVSARLMGGDLGGIASENLSHPKPRYTKRNGNALDAKRVWSYRSSTRVAVELRLQLLSGEQLWVAEGATLVDARGREVPVLPLWQAAPIALGKFQSVVVEAEASTEEAQGSYTLKLWEAGGARSVTVEGIVFPPAPGSTAP